MELTTKVTIGDRYGTKLGNMTLEDARFFGRPNFSGEMDQFKDDRRRFTVLIPNESADELRDMGWNVKTTIPTTEDQDPISHMKVAVDFRWDSMHPGDIDYERGPDVWIIQGEEREKLTSKTVGVLDRSRIELLDMEIRAWEYDPEDKPGQHSARLVSLVAVLRPSILENKYGRLT